MVDILDKSEAKSLWFKVRDTWKKYFSYSQQVKRDYRWLIMFVAARLPWGRALGSYFYRALCLSELKHQSPIDKQVIGSSGVEHAKEQLSQFKQESSLFKDILSATVVRSIKEQGYYLGLILPDNTIAELLEYAYSADLYIDGNKDFSFKYKDKDLAAVQYERQILIGNYLGVNTECLAMQNLSNDPKLREIAAGYLGKEPVLVRSQMGWTFIGDKQAYARKGELGSPTVLFHYDLDDYRALKFFFYLTDVDSFSGSHRCIAGSHRKRSVVHYFLRSQSDQEIANYYGKENMIEICGQTGFGFAEDPFCFHRGSPPTKAPRLMIQLEYALNNYGMWEL
ncbi:MAG: hypothetical protein AAF652_05515 [Cyanobacteria bacterium P01_C01_bin.72]